MKMMSIDKDKPKTMTRIKSNGQLGDFVLSLAAKQNFIAN